MEGYKKSRIAAEKKVTKTIKLIDRALRKEVATTDFEKLVLRVEIALPDSVTESSFPPDVKVEIIAKIISKLKSEKLRHRRIDKQSLCEGRRFLQSSEGKAWMKAWFLPKTAEPKESPKRKPSTSRTRKLARLTLPVEPSPSSGSKELPGVPDTPLSTQSSSSYMTPPDIISLAISSPTGSVSSIKDLPSPATAPDLSNMICAPPAPKQAGETVVYDPEEGGLCLRCWTIHSRRIGGPFFGKWSLSHTGPLTPFRLGDHNDEANGHSQKLPASRGVGTFAIGVAITFGSLVWLLNMFVGSQPRTQ